MKKYIAIFALPFLWWTQTIGFYESLFSMMHRLKKTVSDTTQLYKLKKEYRGFENKHNQQVAQILKNSIYYKITPVCSYLLKNNFYVRNKYIPDQNFYTVKDIARLVAFGKNHFKEQENMVDLFDTLIEMKCDILDKAYEEIYDKSYYKQKETLQSKINNLKKSSLEPAYCKNNNIIKTIIKTEL